MSFTDTSSSFYWHVIHTFYQIWTRGLNRRTRLTYFSMCTSLEPSHETHINNPNHRRLPPTIHSPTATFPIRFTEKAPSPSAKKLNGQVRWVVGYGCENCNQIPFTLPSDGKDVLQTTLLLGFGSDQVDVVGVAWEEEEEEELRLLI